MTIGLAPLLLLVDTMVVLLAVKAEVGAAAIRARALFYLRIHRVSIQAMPQGILSTSALVLPGRLSNKVP
jgi:hypothetical protein